MKREVLEKVIDKLIEEAKSVVLGVKYFYDLQINIK